MPRQSSFGWIQGQNLGFDNKKLVPILCLTGFLKLWVPLYFKLLYKEYASVFLSTDMTGTWHTTVIKADSVPAVRKPLVWGVGQAVEWTVKRLDALMGDAGVHSRGIRPSHRR